MRCSVLADEAGSRSLGYWPGTVTATAFLVQGATATSRTSAGPRDRADTLWRLSWCLYLRRHRERESVCVCVCLPACASVCVCVCVCVCVLSLIHI